VSFIFLAPPSVLGVAVSLPSTSFGSSRSPWSAYLIFSSWLEAMVDFEGQKLAELIFYVVIIAFGGVGWVVGFLQQDFTIVFQAWLVGVVLSVIVRCQP
jgi:Microsomal signal peptidase 12 kDa subunit (SPC12)